MLFELYLYIRNATLQEPTEYLTHRTSCHLSQSKRFTSCGSNVCLGINLQFLIHHKRTSVQTYLNFQYRYMLDQQVKYWIFLTVRMLIGCHRCSCQDIYEILLKVVLKTNQPIPQWVSILQANHSCMDIYIYYMLFSYQTGYIM